MTTNRSPDKEKRKKISIEPTFWLAIITGLATLIVAFFQFYGNYLTAELEIGAKATAVAANRTSTPSPTKTPTAGTISPTLSGTLTLEDQVSTLESEVSLLQTQVAANGEVKQELDFVSNRLGEMESLVETNPSEAMAYVVLRKELDEARSDIKDLELRQTNSWTLRTSLSMA